MNLEHLAKFLGISKTTVSRALNGYPEVNGKTRERVLKAAKDAGYQPNPMARGLALGRTNVFGMFYPLLPADLGDAMFLDVVSGMSAALENFNKHLVIVPVSPASELRAYQQIVRSRRVDGLLVARTLVKDERIAFLSQAKFPFIAYGRTGQAAPYAWFDYDDAAGIEMAMGRLLALGHRRVALVSAPLELNFARARKDSFIASMAAAGLTADPRYLLAGPMDKHSGYAAMRRLLACTPRPSAVIVDNHLAGVGAVRALRDAGVQMGKQMSVIVWGSVADSLDGADVATIDQPEPAKAGVRMAEMLLALVNGTPPTELKELWQPALLPGATVGACPEG